MEFTIVISLVVNVIINILYGPLSSSSQSSYENILQESSGNNAVEQCINQAMTTADDK